MSRFLRATVLLLCVACGSGCATIGAPRAAELTAQVQQGRAITLGHCASCHAIGSDDQSPWAGAPAFRDLRIDPNALSYARRLERLGGPHVHMPPSTLSMADYRAIAAYVAALR